MVIVGVVCNIHDPAGCNEKQTSSFVSNEYLLHTCFQTTLKHINNFSYYFVENNNDFSVFKKKTFM